MDIMRTIINSNNMEIKITITTIITILSLRMLLIKELGIYPSEKIELNPKYNSKITLQDLRRLHLLDLCRAAVPLKKSKNGSMKVSKKENNNKMSKIKLMSVMELRRNKP